MFTLATDKEIFTKKIVQEPTDQTAASPTYLIIGEAIHLDASSHLKIVQSNSFQQAISYLEKQKVAGHYPNFILINLPFNSEHLVHFKYWLDKNFTIKIPLFYNEAVLDSNLYMMLIKNDLVDDVVSAKHPMSTLEEKAAFIKKYSQQSNVAPQPSSALSIKGYKVGLLKRIFDVIIALIAIIVLSPLFILIAIIIKYESEGPVLYKSKRAGHGFKVFDFYKFRTMEVDADKRISELSLLNQYSSAQNAPTFFKLRNDPRVTKIGVFLRNCSLDELPQFFNVLKGDMSIVGNRPLPLYEARTLTTNELAERFMAPAGITGLWQVSKRGREEMSAAERIQIDIDYARKHSLKNDLLIMLKTPSALIQKSNV